MTNSNQNISFTERKLTEEIIDIGNVLIDVKDQDLVRMEERRFVAVFLPMFVGDEVQLYADHGANVDTWRRLAGGAQKEVVIVDHNNAELYRVPPLFDMEAIKPFDSKDPSRTVPSISDMLARANMIAKQGPVAFQNYMDTELERRVNLISNGKRDESDYIKRWNEIFKRYNRPLIPENLFAGTGQVATAQAAQNERPADNDEFEPIDA